MMENVAPFCCSWFPCVLRVPLFCKVVQIAIRDEFQMSFLGSQLSLVALESGESKSILTVQIGCIWHIWLHSRLLPLLGHSVIVVSCHDERFQWIQPATCPAFSMLSVLKMNGYQENPLGDNFIAILTSLLADEERWCARSLIKLRFVNCTFIVYWNAWRLDYILTWSVFKLALWLLKVAHLCQRGFCLEATNHAKALKSSFLFLGRIAEGKRIVSARSPQKPFSG